MADDIRVALSLHSHPATHKDHAEPHPDCLECAVAPSSEPSIPADALDLLALRLYGRKAKPREFIGGSDAIILRDAAERIGRAEDAFMAAGRLRSFFYVKWELAHGPDACKHGIAKAFSCRDCDEATVEAYYAALAAPSGVKP